MTRPLTLAALALLVALPGLAQEPVRPASLVGEEPRGAEMAPASRMFEIHSGRLWLDGRALPPSAVPDGIDLTGVVMQLELVGPVTPVLEVDGVPYVLENERLVPFETSSKAGNPVYILGEMAVAPEAAPADRLQPVVREAYRRELSTEDEALFAKMQTEERLEGEINAIARRARGLPPGPEYDALATDLRARLGRLFDLKQEIRVEELDRTEAEIRALRAVLAERATMREQIIDNRFLDLMGETPIDR